MIIFQTEVTAERIRDKIAASKAKGMWMGGTVPIGYRAEARGLHPVPEEAALVRRIFERYLALGSVRKLKAELDSEGVRTPERRHRNGRRTGGCSFSHGKLYVMLRNPIFIGRIRHKDAVHPGQHLAIIDEALWQAAQDQLATHHRERPVRLTAHATSPLAGKLFDTDGQKMRPSHANKKGRRYRYYVSAALIDSSVAAGASGWRIQAGEMEAAVTDAVAARLRQPEFIGEALRSTEVGAEASDRIVAAISSTADRREARHRRMPWKLSGC